MWINFLALLLGLATLVWAADLFVSGAASIAKNYGVSSLLVGLTIVGLGTSAPEILVSMFASWQGNAGLAVGNALGSNIANIGLILGCTALVTPIAVHSEILKRELPILLIASLSCYLLAVIDQIHGRIDGVLMLGGLWLFLWWLINSAKQARKSDPFSQEVEEDIPASLPISKAWIYSVVGLIGLLLSSKLLVWGAVNIAEYFAVSDLVIGLTIVALGTSLPELAASITSVLKKEDDLAIGNIIGSNMYNLLAVYALPGIIAPGPLSGFAIARDFPVMLGFTVLLFVLGYGRQQSGRICRWEGGLLLCGYCTYQWMVFQSVT